MSDDWHHLLRRLKLTDEDIREVALRACRKGHRRQATDELCQAVVSEVYVELLPRLAADPSQDFFSAPEKLLGYVYRVAFNARGADIRDRSRKVEVRTADPQVLSERTGHFEDEYGRARAEILSLLSDCQHACQKCLTDASELQREAFRLWCGGMTFRQIGARMRFSKETAWRRWHEAAEHFRDTCGEGLLDTTETEKRK